MPSNAKQKTSMLIRGFVPYQEKKGEEYMFWMYEFEDPADYNSIRLVRSSIFCING